MSSKGTRKNGLWNGHVHDRPRNMFDQIHVKHYKINHDAILLKCRLEQILRSEHFNIKMALFTFTYCCCSHILFSATDKMIPWPSIIGFCNDSTVNYNVNCY
jgi:hypothetical protein